MEEAAEQPRQRLCTFEFLSFNQLNEYLSLFIETNLLEYLDGTNTYKTTEKGLHFLNA